MVDLPLSIVVLTSIPAYLLGLYYLHRASKISRYLVLAYLVVMAYGIAIELLDIRVSHDYHYSKFLVMFGPEPDWVPLAIGFSWGSIIYVAMRTSDLLTLPWYQRPLLDGTLAVSVDMMIDPVSSASRWVVAGAACPLDGPTFGGMGVWVWCVPQGDTALWYNIPLANFSGWWIVVAAISLAIRIGARYGKAVERPWWQQLAILLVLAAVAFGAVAGFGLLYATVLKSAWSQRLLLTLLMLVPLGLLALQVKTLSFDNPFEVGLLAMPIFAFVGGLFTFFIAGIDRDPTVGLEHLRWPGAAVLIVATAAISATLLLMPYWKTFASRRTGG